jgi:hypothetical protein
MKIELAGSIEPLTRRSVLRGVAASAAAALAGSCGGGSGMSSATAPGNPQPQPTGPTSSAAVTVSSTIAGTVPARFAGLSYEKSSLAQPRFEASNTDLIGLFRGLGPSLLRVGGNSVDQTQWTPTGAGRTAGQVAPSDIDALAAFLKATDWTVLYGVNLATATAAAAAAEVAYTITSLGASLSGIEIGNECDLYGDPNNYFAGNWTLQDFEQRWEQFRTAILASSPGVLITGPASAAHLMTWTIPFAQYATKEQLALLTQHYYRGDGQSSTSTDALLLSPDSTLLTQLGQLDAAAKAIGIPYRISETNSFYNGGASGVSDSYASALWVIDHLYNIALGGGVGANLHGGGNGPGYTPIADSNGTVIEARPEYYGVKLFTLAGSGSLLATTVAAASLNVTAYAVQSSSGTLSIIVLNKDTTQNLAVTIDCGHSVHSASLLLMTGPALAATSGVQIQGAGVGTDGSFTPQSPWTLPVTGSTLSCYVSPLSAALILTS